MSRIATLPARARLAIVTTLLVLEVPLGYLSVTFAPEGASLSPYWPNAGVSVMALALATPRWRPLVVAAIMPASMLANGLGGRPFDIALALGVLNAVEPAVVIALLTIGRPYPALRRLDDFARMCAAAFAGASIAGLMAGGIVTFFGTGDFVVAGRAVFSSHASALLIIPPLVMGLPRLPRRATALEAAAQWLLLFGVLLLVFAPGQAMPMTFACFPLLMWGAVRLGPRHVAAQLVLYGTLKAILTIAGFGPFDAYVRRTGAPVELIGNLLTADLVASALVVYPLLMARTEQWRSLVRLSRSHEMVDTILAATTGTAILGTDLRGRVTFFNVGAERLTGYLADDVVGAYAIDLCPDSRNRLVLVPYEQVTTSEGLLGQALRPLTEADRQHITSDWELVRADGEVRTISAAVSVRLGDDGEAVGFLGVADDVTERRSQEESVRRALEAEQQLVERLAQVDQTKNDFMATVSHELRTPITSVIGYSELLLSDESAVMPAMHRSILGRIERNGRRLMGLIEDMLTMSQVEMGDFRFKMEPVDLRECVHLAIESMQPSMAMKRISLQHRIPHGPVWIDGDSEKLERVFVNLLSNAAKFSHEGDTVEVTLDAHAGMAVFSVSDTGLGITPEEQVHLFDRFFKGADAHAMAIQGAGLGLSIASSIIDGHDGRIEVASEPGAGSTFVVRIPLRSEEGLEDERASA